MYGPVKVGLLSLLVLIIYAVVRSKVRKRRNDAKAAALGCQPAPTLKSTNLIGNSILRESMKAQKADRGPQFIVEKMDGVLPGCHTVRVPILDYQIFV